MRNAGTSRSLARSSLPFPALHPYDGRGTEGHVPEHQYPGNRHAAGTRRGDPQEPFPAHPGPGSHPATAYGAYRAQSCLRLGSEPFTWSAVNLYHNPVSKSYKVTELEINASFEGLQGDLARLAAASLWAEIVQNPSAAGEHRRRVVRSLQGIAAAPGARGCGAGAIRDHALPLAVSLARRLPADINACCHAAPRLGKDPPRSRRTHGFLCAACAPSNTLAVPAGALRYLAACAEIPLSRACEITMDPAGLRALRDTLPLMVQSVLEGELVTLRAVGAGSVRVFAALPLPRAAVERFSGIIAPIRRGNPGLRWVRNPPTT